MITEENLEFPFPKAPKRKSLLESVPDDTIFRAAAERLQELSKKRSGVRVEYGAYEFVFHHGEFYQIVQRRHDRLFEDNSPFVIRDQPRAQVS